MHAITAKPTQAGRADEGAVGSHRFVEQDVWEVAVAHDQEVLPGGDDLTFTMNTHDAIRQVCNECCIQCASERNMVSGP